MSGTIFSQMRRYVRDGALEQAAGQMGSLMKSVPDGLPLEVASEGRRLVGQSRVIAELPIANALEARDSFRKDLLSFLTRLEQAWGGLPLPAIAKPVGRPPPPDPQSPLIDRREAALADNPIRRLAWLEDGLAAARAVCRITVDAKKHGTGFLLRNGRLVTNNHVLESAADARSAVVLFNYQEDRRGVPLRHVEYKLNPDDFATSALLDCTIVGVVAPADELRELWGGLAIADSDPQDSASVSIIQHPEGGYKRVALVGSVVTGAASPPHVYYETSTMRGSSGAPVLDDDWRVVALHRAAGEWWEPRRRYVNNEGVLFSAIRADAELRAQLG